MSVSVSTTLTAPEGESSGSPQAREERVAEVGVGGKSACTCPRCGLYRWYPPLLLLSTVMAGVFCWMYITKPVFLSQPRETQPVDAQPALQEGKPAGPGELVPPTAEGAGRLDPAVARLPGDPGSDLAADLEAPGLMGEGLKPLRVKREGPPLFRPFPIDPQSSRPESVGEERGGPEPDGESAPRVSALSPQESKGSRSPRSDDESYRVPASFMAEFTSILNSL